MAIEELLEELLSRSLCPRPRWAATVVGDGVGGVDELAAQFLDSDFRESCEPRCRILEVLIEPVYLLESDWIVQLNEVVDVSLRDGDRQELAQSKNPTLKLLISDGIDVAAVAKRLIPGIAVGTVGVKLEIKKGTLFRYGIPLLDEMNTRVIGGSCTTLLEQLEEFRGRERGTFAERVRDALHLVNTDFSESLQIDVQVPEIRPPRMPSDTWEANAQRPISATAKTPQPVGKQEKTTKNRKQRQPKAPKAPKTKTPVPAQIQIGTDDDDDEVMFL